MGFELGIAVGLFFGLALGFCFWWKPPAVHPAPGCVVCGSRGLCGCAMVHRPRARVLRVLEGGRKR